MSGTEEKSAEEKRSDMMGKVALGAGGLAVVSGVAVAGVMLARNKKARKALRKGVDQAVKGARDVLTEGAERYQAFQHRINLAGKKAKEAAHIVRGKEKITKH